MHRDFPKLHADVAFRRSAGKIIWQPRIGCWYDDKIFAGEELPEPYTGLGIFEIYEQLEEVSDRDIRVCYRALLKELGLKVLRVNLTQLIPRYASVLGVSPKVEARAGCIFSKLASKLNTGGKDPKGFIGAALYIACRQLGEKLSQKVIAEACNITEVTHKTNGLFVGPLFGLFFLCMFVPFSTAFGAIVGAIYGLSFAFIWAFWDLLTGGPNLSFQWIYLFPFFVHIVVGSLFSLLPTRGKSWRVLVPCGLLAVAPIAVVLLVILRFD